MFTNLRIAAIAGLILALVTMSCGLFAPDANDIRSDAQQTATINAALTQAQIIIYGSATPTVPGGPTATATDGPFLSIVTDVPTNAPTNTNLPNTATATNTPTPTATLNPTFTPLATMTMMSAFNPTASSADNATVSAPNAPANVADCPTDAEMQAAFGFTARGIKPVNTSVKSEGENCKWTLQAVGVYTFTDVPFVRGWQLTVTHSDESIWVYYGDGVKRDIKGATFRYMAGYDPNHWVWDAEDLMAHEFNFGESQGRNPQYVTRNGNLNAPRWHDYDGSSCPTNVVQLAGIVGGSYKQWTWKDWDGGAHLFNASPNQYILLTAAEFTGADAHLDYWNGQQNAADQLNNWNSLALNSASFHCHP